MTTQDLQFYLDAVASNYSLSSTKDYPFETEDTYIVSLGGTRYRYVFEYGKTSDDVSIDIYSIDKDGGKFIARCEGMKEMTSVSRVIRRMNDIAAVAA